MISICWLNFLYKNKFIERQYLEQLALDYDVDPKGEIIQEILSKIPCRWMNLTREWLDNSPEDDMILSYYASDSMFNILERFSRGLPIIEQEYQKFIDTNGSIFRSPRPDIDFMVFRGVR